MTTATTKERPATLEEARAKLEELKRKKIAFEEKRKREKIQEALDKARSKLQGAQKKRKLALQQATAKTWSRKRPLPVSSLPLISALSEPLTITGISATGPPECVLHPWETDDPSFGSLQELEEALGGPSGIEALRRGESSPENNTSESSPKAPTSDRNEQKMLLQSELKALKQKLEKLSSQKQDKPRYTKEELEKRKANAQTTMEISSWKLYCSKQEVLLETIQDSLQGTAQAIQEGSEIQTKNQKSIANLEKELQVLQRRRAVVEEGLERALRELLRARSQRSKENSATVLK